MSKAIKSSKKNKTALPKEELPQKISSPSAKSNSTDEDMNADQSLDNDAIFASFINKSSKQKTKVVKEVDEAIVIDQSQSEHIIDLFTQFGLEFKDVIEEPRFAIIRKYSDQIKNDASSNKFDVKKLFTSVTRPMKAIFEAYNNLEEAPEVIRSIVQNNFNPNIVKCIKKPTKSKNVYPRLQASSDVTKLNWFDFTLVSIKKKSHFESHCVEIQIYILFATIIIEISKSLSPNLCNSLSKTLINILKNYIDYSFNDTNKIPVVSKVSSLASSSMSFNINKSKFKRPTFVESPVYTETPPIPIVVPTTNRKKKARDVIASASKEDIENLLPSFAKASISHKKKGDKNSIPPNVLQNMDSSEDESEEQIINSEKDNNSEDIEDEVEEEDEEEDEDEDEEEIRNEILKNCSPRKNIIIHSDNEN